MATTKAPLFGLDASGSLAKSIVFSKWKGRTYVRRHSVPSNPQSPLQVSMRAAFKFLTQSYAGLTAGEKAAWEAIAAEKQTTGLNEYVSFNQQRHRFNIALSTADPATGAGAAPSAPATFTASDGRLSSNLAWTAGAVVPDYYWQISMDQTTLATVSVNTTIIIVPAATLSIRVSPLLPGVVYAFRMRGALKTGVAGADFAEVLATPTV